MQFQQPQFLWLLLLVSVPALLYLVRPKSKLIEVSTLVFFKSISKQHNESLPLRRVKKIISFILTQIVLCSCILALAQWLRSKQAEQGSYQTVLLLVDRSASMAAINEDGKLRFDLAKSHCQQLIQSYENTDKILIAYDDDPVVVQPRTKASREMISRLNSLKWRPIADDFDKAKDLAIQLAQLEKPALIVNISDHPKEVGNLPEGIKWQTINVAGTSAINVGITSFQIRPSPLASDLFDVYTKVALNEAAKEAVEVNLELSIGSVPNQFRQFILQPDGSQTFEFKVNATGKDELLSLVVDVNGDQLEIDNWMLAPLPKADPVVAVWIRDDSDGQIDAFTNLAFQSIQKTGSLDLLAGTPAQWPVNDVDVVIFDGWLPDQWPVDVSVIVINPPGSSGPVIAKLLETPIHHESVRTNNPDHPLLYRISSSRLVISQTASVQSGSLESLWTVGNESLLAAGQIEGQKIIIMAFSPQMSQRLPLTASFPLLMGNAILWAASDRTVNIKDYPCGEWVEIESDSVTWTDLHDSKIRVESYRPENSTLELSKLGVWQIDSGERGTSNLLSYQETNIPVAETRERTHRSSSLLTERSLLIFALLILMVESWLFHRIAVY